jgi:uncharacterized protein
MVGRLQHTGAGEVATIIGIGLLAGFLIGSVGVGGVIVVPALTYLFGIDIQLAIAAALMGFILTGIVGPAARVLIAAAVPAAVAGTLMIPRVSPLLLKCLIGVLVSASGLQAILGGPVNDGALTASLPTKRLAIIGAFTSFFSTVSGTGGPLILVPILMWLEQPVLAAIGLSQVIQLPISIVATSTNLIIGAIDVWLGGILAVALAVGCWFGSSAAHHLPAKALRLGVSCLLVVIGSAIVVDVAVKL